MMSLPFSSCSSSRPHRGWRVLASLLLVSLGVMLLASCEQPCTEEVTERCQKECDRIGRCAITFTWTSAGALSKTERVCRWESKPDPKTCGECKDIKKDDKGNVLSKSCVVCNLCSEDFECLENSECKDPSPICDQGVCVGCLKNSDCDDNDAGAACVNGTCVGCSDDADCTENSKPQCHENKCVSCRCSEMDDTKPQCLKKDGKVSCVECIKDDDCKAPKPTCDIKTNTCTAECTKDGDCSDGKKCDGGSCVECAENSDCTDPQKPRCLKGVCLCTADNDCPSNYPSCNSNVCVECTRDGDCGKEFPICKNGACELQECDPANAGKDCLIPGLSCRRVGRKNVCVACSDDIDCQNGTKCDVTCFCCK